MLAVLLYFRWDSKFWNMHFGAFHQLTVWVGRAGLSSQSFFRPCLLYIILNCIFGVLNNLLKGLDWLLYIVIYIWWALRIILVAIVDTFFFIVIALSLLLDSLLHLDQLYGLSLNLLNANRKMKLILLLHFAINLLFMFLFMYLLLLCLISLLLILLTACPLCICYIWL